MQINGLDWSIESYPERWIARCLSQDLIISKRIDSDWAILSEKTPNGQAFRIRVKGIATVNEVINHVYKQYIKEG